MITWLRIGFVAVGLFLVTSVLLPLHCLALALNLKVWRRIPRLWHKSACRLLNIRIRVHGAVESRRPLMIAANHASWKDILVLGSVLDVVFIAKSDVKDWLVFGTLARLQRSIFIERRQPRSTGEQVNDIAVRMADGEVVVLFPEGTTSDGNRLLDVKSSLFGAAAFAVSQAPAGIVHVQPVAIAYTGIHGMPMGRYHRPVAAWPGDIELLPHLIRLLKVGAIEVDVTFGENVDYDASSNRKQVSALVENRIRRMLHSRLRGRETESPDIQ